MLSSPSGIDAEHRIENREASQPVWVGFWRIIKPIKAPFGGAFTVLGRDMTPNGQKGAGERLMACAVTFGQLDQTLDGDSL